LSDFATKQGFNPPTELQRPATDNEFVRSSEKILFSDRHELKSILRKAVIRLKPFKKMPIKTYTWSMTFGTPPFVRHAGKQT
jgi:hypothetical protein